MFPSPLPSPPPSPPLCCPLPRPRRVCLHTFVCIYIHVFLWVAVDDGAHRDGGPDDFEAVPGDDVVAVAGVPELPLRTVLVQPPLVPLGQGRAGLQDMDALDDVHGGQQLHQLGGVCVGSCVRGWRVCVWLVGGGGGASEGSVFSLARGGGGGGYPIVL